MKPLASFLTRLPLAAGSLLAPASATDAGTGTAFGVPLEAFPYLYAGVGFSDMDGRNLPAGVYVARLFGDGLRLTRRLTLVR